MGSPGFFLSKILGRRARVPELPCHLIQLVVYPFAGLAVWSLQGAVLHAHGADTQKTVSLARRAAGDTGELGAAIDCLDYREAHGHAAERTCFTKIVLISLAHAHQLDEAAAVGAIVETVLVRVGTVWSTTVLLRANQDAGVDKFVCLFPKRLVEGLEVSLSRKAPVAVTLLLR